MTCVIAVPQLGPGLRRGSAIRAGVVPIAAMSLAVVPFEVARCEGLEASDGVEETITPPFCSLAPPGRGSG